MEMCSEFQGQRRTVQDSGTESVSLLASHTTVTDSESVQNPARRQRIIFSGIYRKLEREINTMNRRKILMAVVIPALAIAGALVLKNGHDAVLAQDPGALDRRITSLETRLFSIESNLRQVDQEVSIALRSQPSNRLPDPGLQTLQIQVQTLQLELDQMRCGILKLDERTLPAGRRQSNSSSAAQPDPCRSNPESPILIAPRR